jgi:transmembrane sensor
MSRHRREAARIEREASLWVVRCERGLTAPEQDEFLQWIAADRRNSLEFGRQRGNWSRLALLADWRPEHSPSPNRDLLAPAPDRVDRWRTAPRRWLTTAALAAAAAVIVGLFLGKPDPDPVKPVPTFAAIEQRTLTDGTTVTLNRGAEIAVRYSNAERRVMLQTGEAHFNVAKATDRPFVVSVRGIDVRAVGTAFNVRVERAAVEVLVTEGRVQVLPAAAAVPSLADRPVRPPTAMVETGYRSVVQLEGGVAEVTAVTPEEIEELLAWQPRYLDFTDSPLLAVVKEFNRRNAPVRIEIADSSLAQTEVSASLRSDNIEGFVRLLEAGLGVQVDRSGTTIRLHKARQLSSGALPQSPKAQP